MSIWDKMAQDRNLKKNLERAKEGTKQERIENNDFPVKSRTEVIFQLIGYNDFESKEKIPIVTMDFEAASVQGQEELAGHKMQLFFYFKASQYQSVEDVQEAFFQALLDLGLDTHSDTLAKDTTALVASRPYVKGVVAVGKAPKFNKYLNLKGIVDESDLTLLDDTDTSVPENPLPQDNPGTDEEDDNSWNPSQCIGSYVTYDAVEYFIVSGSDDDWTVGLSKEPEGNPDVIVSYDEVEFVSE